MDIQKGISNLSMKAGWKLRAQKMGDITESGHQTCVTTGHTDGGLFYRQVDGDTGGYSCKLSARLHLS